MLLVRDIALPLNFHRRSAAQRTVGQANFPTRMGMAAQLRQAFLDAQDYADRWADFEKKKSMPPLSRTTRKVRHRLPSAT